MMLMLAQPNGHVSMGPLYSRCQPGAAEQDILILMVCITALHLLLVLVHPQRMGGALKPRCTKGWHPWSLCNRGTNLVNLYLYSSV